MVLVACGGESAIPEPGPNSGAFGSGNGEPQKGNGAGSPDQRTREGFCASKGGVRLPSSTQCTADLAKKVFRFAICSCETFDVSGGLKSRSFDSLKQTENRLGGSVGTNEGLLTGGSLEVRGSLWTAKDLDVSGSATVLQDVHADTVDVSGNLEVGADIFAAKAPTGNITLGGKSHVPSPASDPCNCKDPPISIAQYVDAFATQNDNAASKIEGRSLADPPPDTSLTLECGRYYFDSVNVEGSVRLHITGRTAIFVKGDFDVAGRFDLTMDPGAELDLFIAGNLSTSGTSTFGSLASPARMRVYVAGTKVDATGSGELAANIYAPNAIVNFSGGSAIRGAVHAKKVEASGELDINYDEAILALEGCGSAKSEATCKSCNDCDAACIGGKCTACVTSADCCAPLQCSNGACIPSVR